ncbi:hypothetical protein [Anaerospora hongkongensis]|uniref:hypothetical protein n=1 Tax=Anaerospora hongkongensis TaxID=244830 RepID=UPI002FDB5416
MNDLEWGEKIVSVGDPNCACLDCGCAKDDEAARAKLIHLAKLGQQRDWIPVTEGMPDKDGEFLVWDGFTKYVLYYHVQRGCFCPIYPKQPIILYMPLPALPEQEG